MSVTAGYRPIGSNGCSRKSEDLFGKYTLPIRTNIPRLVCLGNTKPIYTPGPFVFFSVVSTFGGFV